MPRDGTGTEKRNTYVMYVAGVLLCGVVQVKLVQGNDIFILHE